MMNFSEKQIKDLVARRHPEYASSIEHWKFCSLSYEGGKGYVCKDNLFRFYKEGDKEFTDRLKRTYRANHTRRVVETVNEFLFRQLPQRDSSTPETLKSFWDRVTRDGLPINSFMGEIDKQLSVYGIVYVVVDRPAAPDDPLNSRRLALPYCYITPPTHMLDAGYNDDGEMVWCLIAEDYRDDADPLASTGKQYIRFRLWTDSEWYLFGPDDPVNKPEKFVLLDHGEHSLGIVPVIKVTSENGRRYSSTSLISDVVYMDRALMNYGALLDEILYEQTFSQLTMPAESVLPGSKEQDQMIAAAKNRIFLYAATAASAKPEFISPDASQAQLIISWMTHLMKQIYAVTGTDYEGNSQASSKGKEYSSGVVRSLDRASIENTLKRRAVILESTENKLAELVMLWMGEDTDIDENWVRYPDHFDTRSLKTDLDVGQALYDMTAPVMVLRQHFKYLVEKLFPRLKPDELDEIKDEIDEWEPMFATEAKQAEDELGIKQQDADTRGDIAENQLEMTQMEIDAADMISRRQQASAEKQARAQAQVAARQAKQAAGAKPKAK